MLKSATYHIVFLLEYLMVLDIEADESFSSYFRGTWRLALHQFLIISGGFLDL